MHMCPQFKIEGYAKAKKNRQIENAIKLRLYFKQAVLHCQTWLILQHNEYSY